MSENTNTEKAYSIADYAEQTVRCAYAGLDPQNVVRLTREGLKTIVESALELYAMDQPARKSQPQGLERSVIKFIDSASGPLGRADVYLAANNLAAAQTNLNTVKDKFTELRLALMTYQKT